MGDVPDPFLRRLSRRIRWEVRGRPAPRVQTPDNHPEPLLNPLIPLLDDTRQQLSFGERSALEGILAQLQPLMSFEIGTHEGGTLRRIAAHSSHVHAFDLTDLVANKATLTNVTFHQGDSKVLVPRVLEQCAAIGRLVDFALIDGDHTAEGVRADLENLLASPACVRSIILTHDTMNHEVRRGITSISLSAHPKVVYVDLDFVPGYRFATGSFAGQYFGGLGLIVTGSRGSDGYRDRPSETRYFPAFDLMHNDSE